MPKTLRIDTFAFVELSEKEKNIRQAIVSFSR